MFDNNLTSQVTSIFPKMRTLQMINLKTICIDAVELSTHLNKTLSTIHRYRKNGTLPQPQYKLNTVYLWDRHEVMLWLAEHGYLDSCNDEYFDIDPFENTEGQ